MAFNRATSLFTLSDSKLRSKLATIRPESMSLTEDCEEAKRSFLHWSSLTSWRSLNSFISPFAHTAVDPLNR
jgi:hypothetical protein